MGFHVIRPEGRKLDSNGSEQVGDGESSRNTFDFLNTAGSPGMASDERDTLSSNKSSLTYVSLS